MTEFEETINELESEKILDRALKLGASYIDLRYQLYTNEEIRVENRSLEDYKSRKFGGLGIRVVFNNAVGFASTSNFAKENIDKTIQVASKLAKSFESVRGKFAEKKVVKKKEIVTTKINPNDVSPEEKVKLLLETNKVAFINDEIKNVRTIMGSGIDNRFFIASDGSEVRLQVPTVGIMQVTTAVSNGNMETVVHRLGACSGYERIQQEDWNHFSTDLSELAVRSAKATTPQAGTYPVIVDPSLVGILTHEAFGHAAEADLVFTGSSTLKDRLGEQLASELVTIIDEGVVNGGYHVPFDDEGTPKGKSVILENGILKGYIHDRNTAEVLAVSPTGNARAQDFENQPIVRMTNTYIEAGDHSFDELIEGIDHGIYIKNKGSGGGQVETGMGTFTFNGGESFMIRKGELAEPVRGVIISGAILDTLKTVDGVGNDKQITTSYHGACGKGSQAAKVGYGGPHIRVREMTVGGR
ncbi:MAG: TldD/PmbA family protein [Candidatus Heimdallarchaeota archaeon]|nr:TldD/PmbA family protein [Candidatus Heimdallarchaeota archaeon]